MNGKSGKKYYEKGERESQISEVEGFQLRTRPKCGHRDGQLK